MTYADRLMRRRHLDGRESVWKPKEQGGQLPMPRYFTDESYRHNQESGKFHGFADDKIIPYREAPKDPNKNQRAKRPVLIKYNHEKMNYFGWNK